MALLTIDSLQISLQNKSHKKILVELSDMKVQQGKITAVVGESGSGKTLTALSILNLLPLNNAFKTQGSIHFENEPILDHNGYIPNIRSIRGNKISMIFQEPMTSLNP